MVTTMLTGALLGVHATLVRVEVDLGRGLPAFRVVGLPEGALREARVRVQASLENCEFAWPQQPINVNLAPADLRKEGSAYDLPIALGTLGATGVLSGKACARLGQYLIASELSLRGELRPVRGVLSLAIAARDAGLRGVIVAPQNAAEASVVEGGEVLSFQRLRDVVAFAQGAGESLEVAPLPPVEPPEHQADMRDVAGQSAARRALEVAAAGGHNLLMIGPPGSGKTMLSRRLSTILPTLSFQEALEVTQVHSVAGLHGGGLIRERPFRAPHHTISDVGMVGGGSGTPRPGEVSLAHNGVLFLDELPEFRRSVLEVLRQPLEDGEVCVNRSLVSVNYPARLMLIASMNPCPCGFQGDPVRECRECPTKARRYQERLSGPLIDRFDMHVEVPALSYAELARTQRGESSAAIRARVEKARQTQSERFQRGGVHANAQMGAGEVREHCTLTEQGHRLLERVVDRFALSARSHARILKVARTIADLDGSASIEVNHLAEASQYRLLDRRNRR